MRIIAADSGAALLSQKFEPLSIVATAAVLVEPPYKEPSLSMAQATFEPADGQRLVVHELFLCKELLKTVRADVVHLDMTLGGISLEELTLAQLSSMKLSARAKYNIRQVLLELRKMAADINRVYRIDVLAIGKESTPIRIAELTAGAYSILYVAEKAVIEGSQLILGLPIACTFQIYGEGVALRSLLPAEHDVRSYVRDEAKILSKIRITETINPQARNFRAALIAPKKEV